MNEAVRQFASPEQNGFTPDSFLPENIMLLKLIQAYVEHEDEEAYFLFLDMEKAFDRCSWDFLMDAIPAIGFDSNFTRYIGLMYSHSNPPNRRMYINGHLSDPFPLGAGVAQGCPLSPLLFLLITEPLSRMFSTNAVMQGVTIDSIRHADDTTLILKPRDAEIALHILRIWEQGTAMMENRAKREGLLLGALRKNPQNAPANLVEAWTQDGKPIRALGVPIGNE
eukprot:3759290-Prymnesium_polylepis.1